MAGGSERGSGNAHDEYQVRRNENELRASRDREARRKRIAARKAAADNARDTKPKPKR